MESVFRYLMKTEYRKSGQETENNGKGFRSLYLPEVLQGLLTVQWERFRSLFGRAPNGEDFIIYSAVGGVLDPDHLSAYWRDVLDGLHLSHVRFHDIRHTFATRAIEQGVDVATVAGLLGHADVTTTTHYYVHQIGRASCRERV